MAAFDEERFGPIAVITTFHTDEEAIAIANTTEYRLRQSSRTILHAPVHRPWNFNVGWFTSTIRR